MNFKELAERLRGIEENATSGATSAGGIATTPIAKEETVDECGGMEVMPRGQQDTVTMNISMNGNGAGGIKDLMDIIRNIENASQDSGEQDNVDIVLGKEDMLAHPDQGGAGASDEGIEDESFGNSAHGASGQHTYDIDAVTATGDDMHSKGGGALKHNGGENPMHEGLLAQLAGLYQEVKLR
jgi:hypothetical protein